MATAVIVLIATPSSGAEPTGSLPTDNSAPEYIRHLSERGLGPLEESELIEDSTRASTGGLMSSRPPEPAVSPRSERCTARAGYRFYKARAAYWAHKMGAAVSRDAASTQPSEGGCPRYLANLMRRKARATRRAYERWAEIHILQDFPFGRGEQAWRRAVVEAQRVFPGTSGWLLSCSAAEGGHGRWMGYSGVSYSKRLRDSDTVGGPMQFRWSTFKGMYRHALDHLRSRGYRVPPQLRDPGDDRAWRSALGQALAGGWARYTGNDNSHWSASWSRGC